MLGLVGYGRRKRQVCRLPISPADWNRNRNRNRLDWVPGTNPGLENGSTGTGADLDDQLASAGLDSRFAGSSQLARAGPARLHRAAPAGHLISWVIYTCVYEDTYVHDPQRPADAILAKVTPEYLRAARRAGEAVLCGRIRSWSRRRPSAGSIRGSVTRCAFTKAKMPALADRMPMFDGLHRVVPGSAGSRSGLELSQVRDHDPTGKNRRRCDLDQEAGPGM